jgi:hypothetical protein
MMNGRGKSDSGILPAKPVNAASHQRTWSHGEPYSGTKGETLDTAKGEPNTSRAGGVGDGESVEGRQLAKGKLRSSRFFHNRNRAFGNTGVRPCNKYFLLILAAFVQA